MSILTAIYLFAMIDRSDFGSARIAGTDQALDLAVGCRTSIARKSEKELEFPSRGE